MYAHKAVVVSEPLGRKEMCATILVRCNLPGVIACAALSSHIAPLPGPEAIHPHLSWNCPGGPFWLFFFFFFFFFSLSFLSLHGTC
jgi:hypothetical protein